MRAFKIYEYAAPLLLLPTSYYLWLQQLDGDHRLTLLVLAMPVLFAYTIPAIGTNWLKLWEFNTRLRLGKFRPHHGFVFGSAISLLTLLIVDTQPDSIGPFDLIRTGFATGSTVAFWNWLYDIYAVKVGFIVVHNRSHYEGLGAEAVATEYAPVFFGAIGACYGLAIHISLYYLVELQRWDLFWPLVVISNLALLTVPVLAYVLHSLIRNGDVGLRPYRKG